VAEWQQCPFCQEVVPGGARNCHNCGESLAPPTRESVFEEQTDLSQIPLDELDDLTLAYLRGAELSGAYLSGADLFGADLAAADLRGADLGGAHLVSADLSGADLSGTNLFGADLSWAELQGADLQGADLRRADLTGAGLRGADLTEALYDDYTRWPEGFAPQSAGAVLAFKRKPRSLGKD
jgi:uncharacterized protein YjbI with pentapeptide repeats